MPSYTFRSVGAADKQIQTVTAGAPAGRVAGDLLLLAGSQRNNAYTLNAIPTGWTDLSPHINDSYNYLLARIADVTATDLPTLTWSGAGTAEAVMSAWFGNVYTDLSTIVHAVVDQSGNGVGTGGNDIQYSALTISLANCLVIAKGMHNKTNTGNGVTVDALAGITQIDQQNYTASVFSRYWGYVQQTTATNMSSVVQTRSGATAENLQQSSIYIALKTASAANAAGKAFIYNQQSTNSG